jgi:hypothetical protein
MNDVVHEQKDSFCVWTKTGHLPRRFHSKREIAEAEAIRLARLNPGKKFIVLHAVDKIHVPAAPSSVTETQAAV